MFKSLFWNIRSISSSGTLERLEQFIILQKPSFIAICEPFNKADKLVKFRNMLGFANAYSNSNSQIWIFWDDFLDCRVVEENEQQVTCIINWMGISILVSSVYAKCDAALREKLWDSLRDTADKYNLPWYIAGDFNCIVDLSEKKGGRPHIMSKSLPFLQCIMDCELLDPGYSGSTFTWCNGWCPERRVWKRLDRVLVNHEWMNLFDSTSVNHLISTGSDHSPLFVIAKSTQREPIKYFKFLDFWTDEPNFKEVVEQAWNMDVQGSPMWRFHLKLKNTCKKLSEWSRNSVGNIFDTVKDLEKKGV